MLSRIIYIIKNYRISFFLRLSYVCVCVCVCVCVLGHCRVVQFSHVQLFATPWTTARQASLSITNSQSSPKPMSIESVMPSSHLILCCPLLLLPSIFPSIRVFSSESVFTSGGQSTGVSASISVLPVNTQDSPLGWTGWISLQSKGLPRVRVVEATKRRMFFLDQHCW